MGRLRSGPACGPSVARSSPRCQRNALRGTGGKLRARRAHITPWQREACVRRATLSVTVRLAVDDLGPLAPDSFPATPKSLWRFRRLLPLGDSPAVFLGEGATPLVHLERLGRRLGLPRLYAKDESQNPTWSYKD